MLEALCSPQDLNSFQLHEKHIWKVHTVKDVVTQQDFQPQIAMEIKVCKGWNASAFCGKDFALPIVDKNRLDRF